MALLKSEDIYNDEIFLYYISALSTIWCSDPANFDWNGFLFLILGPDEDRCSGSILLPSYKISPVSKEDGIYKKFAFKAEHQVHFIF